MKIIANNKKAHHNYQVIEKFELGVALRGTEIKSIRENRVSLNEAFVLERRGELFLVNSNIPEYDKANQFNHRPVRERKLLAHRSEIRKMSIAVNKSGLALVPLSMYLKGAWVKVNIAICRGKAKSDKRQDKITQEAKLEMARALKASR